MKLLVLVLGLAALMGTAYWYLQGTGMHAVDPTEKSAPKQTLDNVRAKTKQFEEDAQRRANETLNKSQGQ